MVYSDDGHYEIRRGEPMPEMVLVPSEGPKYPFPDMDVGDSFTFPHDCRNRISACASRYKRRHGHAFAIRDLGWALGVWRVS